MFQKILKISPTLLAFILLFIMFNDGFFCLFVYSMRSDGAYTYDKKHGKLSQKFRVNAVKKRVAFTFTGLPPKQVKNIEKSFLKIMPEYAMYFHKIWIYEII